MRSRAFAIFCPAAQSGLSIPYPQISIHAIKTVGSGDQTYPSVYLQIELSDGETGGDEFDTVELIIIPQHTSEVTTTITGPTSETQKLFEAISECSNLNPDPVDSDDENADNAERIIFEGDYQPVEGLNNVYVGDSNGGLPPPMPGSGGWITAENMHEHFDADGNWIGGGQLIEDEEEEEGVSGELGHGAGAVHNRDEDDAGESTDKRSRVE